MTTPSSNNIGMIQPQTTWGEFNNLNFIIQQALGKLQTATIVKIVSCTNSGGLSPVGFVDVLPMVNQVDSAGNAMPHTTIHNVPYFRMQGGANAVIIDPQAGDIGIAVFSNRDISKVKNTRGQANPNSGRQFSFSDALYIGGVLNGAPSQFVQFSSSGIRISSPNQVELDAPNITLQAQTVAINGGQMVTITTPTFTVNGNTVLNGGLNAGGGSGGNAVFTGSITATGDISGAGTSLHTHKHGGVQTGGGQTGAPI